MSEEDQTADVATLPKFDMPSYESEMTAKDVKARTIPDDMAWRHHDSDVNNPVPEGGFSVSDVQALTEHVIDLRLVPSGLLFQGGLSTTWDFPGFCPVFKDTEGNAKVAAKKRERKKQGGNGGEGSSLVTKRRKTAAHRDGSAASEATSSSEPIRTLNPNNLSTAIVETAESREDRSPRESPRGLADHSVHNYDTHHGDGGTGNLRLGTSGDPPERAITHVDTEVVQPSPSPRNAFHSSDTTQLASPLRTVQRGNTKAGESSRRGPVHVPDWAIRQRCRLDTPMWCRELMVHLDPPAAQEESNALNNTTALERAWKLVQARLDVQHSSGLYNSLSDRFKAFRSAHEGCARRLEASENCNRELF
ncbi:hypothetical protein Tco_1029116 [Tanacetum coccineum]|uniref:Uncharacterized protein n=1 Tax=Tanacetum coccineum TaxID=301880 RepID=A0ABQ5G2J7_9ASTR